MYFWRLEKLKSEMAAAPLSERETLPYLVVFVALYAASSSVPLTDPNLWDALGGVWSVLLAIFGTLYIYQRNGGDLGRHLLQRYFAIGWVVTIRLLPIILVFALVLYATLEAMGIPTDRTNWYDFLFLAMVETVVYWRIGHHASDLARRAPPTPQGEDPG